MIAFTVPGQPIPKARPRISTRGGFARAYTPKRTVTYEAAVAACARVACRSPLDAAGPVAVAIVAVLARVKRLDKRGLPEGRVWAHGSTTDADNVAKAILDGMQRGGALLNDRSAVRVSIDLVYAARGEAPHAEVRVEAIGDLPWQGAATAGAS